MRGPRWLTEEEQAAWRGLMTTMQVVEAGLDEQLQRDSGMPHAYYMVLVTLSEQPGRACRMSVLAGLTRSSQSRLSHAVRRLESRGWVRRERDGSDGRGTVAELTDEGWQALRAAAPGHVERVRELVLDRLTPAQVRQLAAITEAVVGAGEARGVPTH